MKQYFIIPFLLIAHFCCFAQISFKSFHLAPSERLLGFEKIGETNWLLATGISNATFWGICHLYFLDDQGEILWKKELEDIPTQKSFRLHCLTTKEGNIIVYLRKWYGCFFEKTTPYDGIFCFNKKGEILWSIPHTNNKLDHLSQMAFNHDSTIIFGTSMSNHFKINLLDHQIQYFNAVQKDTFLQSYVIIPSATNPRQMIFFGPTIQVYEDTLRISEVYVSSISHTEHIEGVRLRNTDTLLSFTRLYTSNDASLIIKKVTKDGPLQDSSVFKNFVYVLDANEEYTALYSIDLPSLYTQVSIYKNDDFTKPLRQINLFYGTDNGSITKAKGFFVATGKIEKDQLVVAASINQKVEIITYSLEGDPIEKHTDVALTGIRYGDVEYIEWIDAVTAKIQLKDSKVLVMNRGKEDIQTLSILCQTPTKERVPSSDICISDSTAFRYYDNLNIAPGETKELSLGPLFSSGVNVESGFEIFVSSPNNNMDYNSLDNRKSKGLDMPLPPFPDRYRIFPNPATDRLTFTLPVMKDVLYVDYAVYSITGQRLMRGLLENERGYYYMDITSLSPGIYFVQVGRDLSKFVKM